MNTVAIEKAIESEFVCWYQNDELPTVWVDGKLRMDWTARVPESAGRLLHVLGKDRAGELIRVLERMRDAPDDLLVQRISARTNTDWSYDPESRPDFEDLLNRLIAALRAKAPEGGSSVVPDK